MAESKIEWTERTWNPIVGCSIVSPGCTNCYAMRMAARIEAMNGAAGSGTHYAGTTTKVKHHAVWTGKLALAPESTLLEPIKRKRPTTYFVNSMGDLFHEGCPDEWIDRVFAVMALCPQHTFQVLTKRAERMRGYFTKRQFRDTHPLEVRHDAIDAAMNDIAPAHWCKRELEDYSPDGLPLPNVWLGVSAERQDEADERIPLLLQTPAAVRFVSAEPLLGPIDLTKAFWVGEDGGWEYAGSRRQIIDWVIVGGESGPKARPMHPDWARSIRDQCAAAGIAFFFKQFGEWAPVYDRDHDDPDWRRCDIVKNQTPSGQWLNINGMQGFHAERVIRIDRLGKKAAGRLLDGKEHNEFPLSTRSKSNEANHRCDA